MSNIYIYINMLFNLMPSICLVESCWQEIHLDRLGHFGYSVACLQACCLTLSWQIPKWSRNLLLFESLCCRSFCCQSNCVPQCFKVSPCRSFCSQKPSQRHGLGRLAAPNKDHTKGRTVAPSSQTSCVLCTSGKQLNMGWRDFFCATVSSFHLAQDPQGSKPVEEGWLTSPKLSADLNCFFRHPKT